MADQLKLTRRDMLKLSGGIAAGTMLGTSLPAFASPEAQAQSDVTLEIFDPLGVTEVTAVYSKRLTTLEGKRIGYTEGTWMVGTAKPLVMDLLKKQYPTMVEVPNVPQYGTFQGMTDADVAKWMKDNKVDGMIVGNAG